ncbi:hypothetical protein [Brevundimonas halotolerans]|uniref:Uncharacterized protein n=1 Tax=Brevundimonas halotolerans TaxID=69670 RepID=A0A7W9A243_9CAUL|nr:hypothetical protein [Brevundimonas halotolerans]MBB5659822.1 hypothetical protein [Brevundimonas halotolerans]
MLGLIATILLTTTAPDPVQVRYTPLSDHCEMMDEGAFEGQDWVLHRCQGLPGYPIWIGYADGTRMSLAFGSMQSVSGMFATDRDTSWPVEWRARAGGDFQPYATIVSVRSLTDGTSMLAVYLLAEDGSSCLRGVTATNEAAGELADAPPRQGC